MTREEMLVALVERWRGNAELADGFTFGACSDELAEILAAPEPLDLMREAVVAMKAWFDHEDSSLAYPPGVDRSSPAGEAIWRDWWDRGIGLCQQTQDLMNAALATPLPAPPEDEHG